MLADRDALPSNSDNSDLITKSRGRLQFLSKYHLENYFLEEKVLAAVFQEMEPNESWLCDPSEIRNKIRSIARSRISYATALISAKYFRDCVGNIDIMPKDCHSCDLEMLIQKILDRKEHEHQRINKGIEKEELKNYVEQTYNRVMDSLNADDESWKNDIPGKQVLRIFCNEAKIQEGRLKTLYIKKAEEINENPFNEIIEIFNKFEGM